MNILVDRHHAGLFHSLQLLFEDRLGHTLYTPIGHDWWDAGIWRFGKVFGDDRLAQQYLVPGKPLMYDDEFPERALWGVTLAKAEQMSWGAVLATVQENQVGFYRFAQAHGAKFLVGVGNTNQQIAWNLDPIVLNSSEMPMLGRGVRIGQEFDSDGLFGFSDPSVDCYDSDDYPPLPRISSFVNCMPSIECWPLLAQAIDSLPSVNVHGIDGPQLNLKPIGMIAYEMRHSWWGWHDKIHGDGYGHVIHYWAAIGRPLIGHASHYAGKNGQIFWRDLETCIDLDRHPLDEALALVKEISNDPPRHEAMCRAIRAVFDATTDWAADAEAVRQLLGHP